ncbi:MAG TPA: gliding motility lipoprotein GldH [Flavobacterium sp.]|jgi:gliding motility-associated lipoprotein GldH
MNLRNSLLCLLMALLLFSCDKKRVFDEYRSVGSAWHRDSIITFSLPKLDSVKPYNLYVNVRNNDNYEFNNLFLIVSLEHQSGMTKVDTLEYEMADPEGKLLGQGFSDIKENKLLYKEHAFFKPAGQYNISIRQAVRQHGKVAGVEKLEGVSEVGFRIESLEE